MSDDFSKRIESFGQSVWKKAQGAVNIVGKNSDIAAKTQELKELYADIGKAYCITHPEAAQTEFPDLCGKAAALTSEITRLQDEILQAKGFQKCAACGALVPAPAAFCSSCGASMPQPPSPEPEPAPEPEAEPVCGNCGATLHEQDLFCAACGTKRPQV